MCITEVRIPKETGVLNLLVLVSNRKEGRGTAYCSDLVAVLCESLNFLKIIKLLRREGEPFFFFFSPGRDSAEKTSSSDLSVLTLIRQTVLL